MRTTTSTPPSLDRLLGVVSGPRLDAVAARPAWLSGEPPDGPGGTLTEEDSPGAGASDARGTHGVPSVGEYRAPADGRGRAVEDAARAEWHGHPVGESPTAMGGVRRRMAEHVPERWRGARFAVGRRGAAALAVVGLLAAAAAGVGVLHDRPASVPVPDVAADPVPITAAAAAAGAAAETAGAGRAGGPASEAGGDAGARPDAAGREQAGTMSAAEGADPGQIVVSVQGLVHRSGLVHLDEGARVADALEAAGGPTEGADVLSLNLAQRLADGDQVLVGVAPEDGGAPRLGSATISAGGAGAGDAGSGGPGGGAVDLNTADQAELETLPGVGPVTAEAILQWRRQNGRFTSVDQLTEVRGIGPATLEKLRDAVTV